ncbi:unnamed protein product [Calypogeia fissa]
MEPGRNKQEDRDDDFMNDILDADELSQLMRFIPREEFENFNRKQTRRFLAEELYGCSGDFTENLSLTVEGLTKKRTASSPPPVKGGSKKPKTNNPKSGRDTVWSALVPEEQNLRRDPKKRTAATSKMNVN